MIESRNTRITNISNLSENLITKEMYFGVIRYYPLWVLDNMPKKYYTEDVLIEFIKYWEFGIDNIPKIYRTEKLKLLHEALWVL